MKGGRDVAGGGRCCVTYSKTYKVCTHPLNTTTHPPTQHHPTPPLNDPTQHHHSWRPPTVTSPTYPTPPLLPTHRHQSHPPQTLLTDVELSEVIARREGYLFSNVKLLTEVALQLIRYVLVCEEFISLCTLLLVTVVLVWLF